MSNGVEAMGSVRPELFVIGSPLLIICAQIKEATLRKFGLQKGRFHLLDPQQVQTIVQPIGDFQRMLGGSAATTAVGIAKLGGKVCFAGGYGPDELAKVFLDGLRAAGVVSACEIIADKGGTTRVYILITEDGERTMLPIYGASRHFSLSDHNRQTISNCKMVFADAYQFDAPATEAAVLEAFRLTRANRGTSVLTLSDPGCVKLYREKLLHACASTDILFGNEDELKLLFDTPETGDLERVLSEKCASGEYKLIISTRNEAGSTSFTTRDGVILNEPVKIDKVIDQTGAGDMFAAGFLHAYLRDYDIKTCGKTGSLTAARVIQQVGVAMNDGAIKEVEKLLAPVQ